MTKEELLDKYPDINNHHEYCKEMFIHSRQHSHDWRCMCKVLRAYDAYIELNKE